MGQAMHPPESGFRIEVERSTGDEGPPWHYAGLALTPSTSFELRAVVGSNGTVHVELAAGVSQRIVLRIATLVQSACAQCGPASPPPQRIVRWGAGR